MTSGDWLPAQAPFDLVRRGYSPEQVSAHLERLEYDLRIATANRDESARRITELSSQLSAAQGESDALRAQLDRSALEPVSMANLSDRMQRMIRLAEEEAMEIRSRAEADGDKLRAQLQSALEQTAADRAEFDAEREKTRKQLADQVHELIAEATSEGEATREKARQDAAQLIAEATDEATRIGEEARTAADRLRTETDGYAEQTRTAADEYAQRTISEADDYATRTLVDADERATTQLTEAAQERDRLDAQALAQRTEVQDDFEIAIAARRSEAARTIAVREEKSRATAEKLVADATALSQKLVADATAESELLMQRATTYANALVNRAATEAHHRVSDADQAVQSLTELRAHITDQLASLAGHLDHIRELAGSAPELLAPPAQEADRARAADFPADPTARPTPVDLPVPVLETGEDGDTAVDLAAVDLAVASPVESIEPADTAELNGQQESDTDARPKLRKQPAGDAQAR